MTLEETTAVLAEAVLAGQRAVRLHTGDPSIYGAIQEQMAELDRLGIGYEVVPGVTSAFAAAAALKQELTLPEVYPDRHHHPPGRADPGAGAGKTLGNCRHRRHHGHLSVRRHDRRGGGGTAAGGLYAGNPGGGGGQGLLAG